MVFNQERVHQVIEEIKPLLFKHWEEIAHYKDIPLDPDFKQYQVLEDVGALRIFTARTEEGQLIGYAIFFIRKNIHYQSSLQAVQDVLFIDPAWRGTGVKFIIWCDQRLAEMGVEVVYHHVKKVHNFGPLLERLGYEEVDLIYARRF